MISRIAQRAAVRYRRAIMEAPIEALINPERDEIDELFSVYSDVYKEMHGIRPRSINLDKISLDDMKAEYDSLMKQYEDTMGQREQEWGEEKKAESEQLQFEEKEEKAEKGFKEEYGEQYLKYLEDESW